MRIEEVIWLDKIIDKLTIKHHIDTNEVEEVLSNRPKFRFVEKGDRQGENAGRFLVERKDC